MHLPVSCQKRGCSALRGCQSAVAPEQGDLAYMFILSATDKQWAKSKTTLKKLIDTFHV